MGTNRTQPFGYRMEYGKVATDPDEASKYALSERLICGECGTLYRRCMEHSRKKESSLAMCEPSGLWHEILP